MTTVSAQSPFGEIVFTITGGDPENDQLQFSMSSSDLNVPFMVDQNSKHQLSLILLTNFTK